ncbi:MAG: HAD-IIIA family hydrolase [bacterium]
MTAQAQAVVLCGGRATRLAAVLGELPKVLVPVAGEPLLQHLLRDLGAAGVGEVLLLAGVGGDRVREAAAELAPAGLTVETIIEPALRGTAGALHGAAERLAERFLLIYGDVFTAVDWPRLAAFDAARAGLATLLVHRSDHPQDSDVVVTDDRDRVTGWRGCDPATRPAASVPAAALTNAGVAVFHRNLLHNVPPDRASDLFGEVLPALVAAGEPVFAYRSSEYVKDLGTPQRLAAVERDVSAGRARLRAEVVLLDRDGVLNEEVGNVSRPDQLRLLPGAAEGLRRLNEAGIRVAVVTNQAVVARGLCTAEELDGIHDHLAELLLAQGARLDGLHVCPHHPETHHGEGVEALRGPCSCRKPAVGLVDEALAALDAPAWRTVVIGDSTIDLQLASNAGLASIAVDTGHGCQDGRHPAREVWHFPDLAAAATWIVSG